MKQKKYQRPTTMVVQLRQQCCILSGSGEPKLGANRQEYESEEWQ